jgi:hypothetical protein
MCWTDVEDYNADRAMRSDVQPMPFKPKIRSCYIAIWCRIGEKDVFCHEVIASSLEEAIARSKAEILMALGPNYALWELAAVTARCIVENKSARPEAVKRV